MSAKFSHEQSVTDNDVDLGICTVIGRRDIHRDVTFCWLGYPLNERLDVSTSKDLIGLNRLKVRQLSDT